MAVDPEPRPFDPAADTAAWQAFVLDDAPEARPAARQGWFGRLIARFRR